MEGKGVLFKRFAGIDVFDIEVNTEDPEELIRFCQLLEPTVGGINLEDIRAPDCFVVEERLKATLQIPVFHDDQHGTAIIAGAGLLNALSSPGSPWTRSGWSSPGRGPRPSPPRSTSSAWGSPGSTSSRWTSTG
jgi:malic enzyme